MATTTTNATTINEGDFDALFLDENNRAMLKDAYQAVTKANRWGYLRRPDVPGTKPCPHCSSLLRGVCNGGQCLCQGVCRICEGKGFREEGFMLSDAPELKEIDLYMEYEGHSGSSYAWTMRTMEMIAKKGWLAYVAKIGGRPSLMDSVKAVDSVMNDAINAKVSTLEDFANILEKSATIRQTIPDFEEQLGGIRQYIKAVDDSKKDPNSWTKSAGFPYPCMCHRRQGKEGWCGVAGFGVPGCEH